MSKPIVAQLTKATGDYPKGAELGFDTEAKATSVLGEGAYKIVRHTDGSEYEAPARVTDGPATETNEPKAKKS